MIKITNAEWLNQPFQIIPDFLLDLKEVKSVSVRQSKYYVRVNLAEKKEMLVIREEDVPKELVDYIEGKNDDEVKLHMASVTAQNQLAGFKHKSITVYKHSIEAMSIEEGIATIYTKGGIRINGFVDEQR